MDAECVREAQAKGLNVIQGDLNRPLPFESEQFRCVFGVSVLEHLLNGCAFMKECHRVLEPNGMLVLLTPNISTFFTIALLLVRKMPSSGPHPDSNALLAGDELFKVSRKRDILVGTRESAFYVPFVPGLRYSSRISRPRNIMRSRSAQWLYGTFVSKVLVVRNATGEARG